MVCVCVCVCEQTDDGDGDSESDKWSLPKGVEDCCCFYRSENPDLIVKAMKGRHTEIK